MFPPYFSLNPVRLHDRQHAFSAGANETLSSPKAKVCKAGFLRFKPFGIGPFPLNPFSFSRLLIFNLLMAGQ
jgi:hypothetical protein